MREDPDGAPSEQSGRGVVICAGGGSMLLNAYVNICVLRRTLKSKLPVEVWHLGPEEMSPVAAALLEALDVELVDAYGKLRRHPARIHDGWQLKAYALLYSRFAEVLLLDADQVCVSDPEALFECETYSRTGALFWPDIVDLRADARIWAEVGLAPSTMPSFESGQLIVDKRRHWRALRLALAFNEEAERFYRLIYGDKDTFLIAWLLEDDAYDIVTQRPTQTSYGLLQHGPDGAPLFQHRTYAKWSYAGPQLLAKEFIHEAACLAAIEELREAWSGKIFHPPARSLRARTAESGLAGTTLRLSRLGGADALIELRPHGEIGKGRAGDRQNWYVTEGSDGGMLVLNVLGGSHAGLRFAQESPGRWLQLPPFSGTPLVAALEPEESGLSAPYGLIDDLLKAAGFPEPTEEDAARLSAAFGLLARADPTFAEDLRERARKEPRLASFAERVEKPVRKALRSDSTLFHTDYNSILKLK